jgi:glycosyltransferase involved in cell wall biosynthesis
MDKIVVISEHAKFGFINTVFGDEQGNQFKVNTPIEVVHFPIKNTEPSKLDLELKTDFNFLSVNQWGPRKNIEMLVSCFIEEFRDEDVGLVLKTNAANDSHIDKLQVEAKLKVLVDSKGDHKCKIYLIHGHMTDEEMQALYTHPKIKGFVTSTHGEGFGFPIFEAVCNELPVVATDWSGHLDFLSTKDEDGDDKKLFAKVDYEIKQLEPQHVWGGVMEAQAGWAYPKVSSLKNRMREVYKDNTRFKSWAKKLAKFNKEKFAHKEITDKFINVFGPVEEQQDELIVL